MKIGDRVRVIALDDEIYEGEVFYVDDNCFDMTDGESDLYCPLFSEVKSITILN